MKHSFFKTSLYIFVLSFSMAACYPGGPEYIEDYDAVYTQQIDLNFDWDDKTKNVYFMPDTVMDLSDPDSDPSPITSPAHILGQVALQMNSYGFTRETDTAKALNSDFIVLVSRARSNNYVTTWWGGWGGWYGWGWGGCCYYPPTTVSNYRTGSLLVEIINTAELDSTNKVIPFLWQGAGEGLFEGTNSSIQNRGDKAISQMFLQSPYLNRN